MEWGSTQSTKLFLESVVKFTGNALYFYQKLIFFLGEHVTSNKLTETQIVTQWAIFGDNINLHNLSSSF